MDYLLRRYLGNKSRVGTVPLLGSWARGRPIPAVFQIPTFSQSSLNLPRRSIILPISQGFLHLSDQGCSRVWGIPARHHSRKRRWCEPMRMNVTSIDQSNHLPCSRISMIRQRDTSSTPRVEIGAGHAADRYSANPLLLPDGHPATRTTNKYLFGRFKKPETTSLQVF